MVNQRSACKFIICDSLKNLAHCFYFSIQEELEIEKKDLEKEKEEIERQVNTEVHTVLWTKRITKIQTSLTQFSKISKHTSEVVQIIEGMIRLGKLYTAHICGT